MLSVALEIYPWTGIRVGAPSWHRDLPQLDRYKVEKAREKESEISYNSRPWLSPRVTNDFFPCFSSLSLTLVLPPFQCWVTHILLFSHTTPKLWLMIALLFTILLSSYNLYKNISLSYKIKNKFDKKWCIGIFFVASSVWYILLSQFRYTFYYIYCFSLWFGGKKRKNVKKLN